MAVETKSNEFVELSDNLTLVSTLWGGTQSMREAKTAYLPQEPGETSKEYGNRLARSTFTNIFRKTIKGLVGRIYSEEVAIKDDDSFLEFSENVDLEGRDIQRFSYDVCLSTLRDGVRYVMVEAPIAAGATTKADEKALGIRPYWVEIDARNVLGISYEIIGAQKVIKQFRYIETVTEKTGEFDEKQKQQIRVIEPNLIRIFTKDEKLGTWIESQKIPTSFGDVQIVEFCADKLDKSPPLLDLAHLNIEHWQKASDQSNILHVARVPILHWAGATERVNEDGKPIEIVIGPNTLVKSRDSSSRLEYVEHSGAAIGAGRDDLLDLEKRMEAMGAEFVTAKPGTMTATEAMINKTADVSDLSAFAKNMKDSFELALQITARSIGREFTGYVSINSKLGVVHEKPNVETAIKLRAVGDISHNTLIDIVNNAWGLEIDPDEEIDTAQSETPVSE